MEAHCIARQGNEKQRGERLSNRTLSELKDSTAGQRGALHCKVVHRKAKKSTATQGKEKHSNALCRFYESVYRVERLYCIEMHRNESNRNDKQRKAAHRIARKSNAASSCFKPELSESL